MKTTAILSKTTRSLCIGLLFLFGVQTLLQGQTFDSSVNAFLSANDKVSNIGLTAHVKTSEIVKLVKDELKHPLAEGGSPELGFMLHADEAVTIEELTRMMISPAREAYDEIRRIPRTVIERVKTGTRAFNCLITPWKWGKCWEDVWEDVKKTYIDEVKFHIEAVEAVYQDVLVPVIKINQVIFPIKGKFNYKVDIDDLDISFAENKYTVVGIFDVSVRTSIYMDHLPQTITPKGNVDTHFKIKVTQKGFIEIKPEGKIQVSDPSTELVFQEAFGSGFVVDAIDLGSKTNPVSDYLLDLAGKEIDKQLNKAVEKAIEKNSSKINIKEYAIKLIKEFDKPVKIGDNGFMYPNITGVFVSQINGRQVSGENLVEIKFGLKFQPFATFASSVSPVSDKDTLIHFGTEIIEGDGINVSLPVFLKYDFIAEQLKPFANAFNKKNEDKFLIKRYLINNPSAAFADAGKVTLGVELLKRKKNKKIGTAKLDAHFIASPSDTSVRAQVSNIKIKTTNLLVFILKPLIKREIKKEAEKNNSKNLSEEIITAAHQLDNKMIFKTRLGTIKGTTKSLSLTDIMAQPDFMLLKINMTGTVGFNNAETLE